MLCYDDRDMARSLQDPRCAATGTGAPTLERRPLIRVRLGNEELVDVESEIVLCVRDRRVEHLLDGQGSLAIREVKHRSRFFHGESTNEVEYPSHLVGRLPYMLGLGSHVPRCLTDLSVW